MPQLEERLFEAMTSLREVQPGSERHMFVITRGLAYALQKIDPQQVPTVAQDGVALFLRPPA